MCKFLFSCNYIYLVPFLRYSMSNSAMPLKSGLRVTRSMKTVPYVTSYWTYIWNMEVLLYLVNSFESFDIEKCRDLEGCLRSIRPCRLYTHHSLQWSCNVFTVPHCLPHCPDVWPVVSCQHRLVHRVGRMAEPLQWLLCLVYHFRVIWRWIIIIIIIIILIIIYRLLSRHRS